MMFDQWWEKNFPGRSYVNRYACAEQAWRDGQRELRTLIAKATSSLPGDIAEVIGDRIKDFPLEGDDEV